MKTILIAVFFFANFAYAGSVKISKIEGEVQYRESASDEWKTAEASMSVPEGGAIKTGINGMAVIEMENKSKVWMRENTALEVEQKKDLITRLGLVFGKIKARIPHLMRREKYEIRTQTAVCAVRGTDLILETDTEGKMNLQVLFGEVKMTYAIPPLKGDKEFTVSQGEFIAIKDKDKPSKKMMMDKKMEMNGLAKWDPGLTENQRVEDIKKKEMDRVQIRDFANTTKQTEDMIKGFTYKGREADIEAGRTLRDVQGNLVRVDQRLMRPDPQTLQFINLVKRPVYRDYINSSAYSASDGFKYNGGALTNRYDMMMFTMNFSKALPQSMMEWPSFFSNNDIKATQASFLAANRTKDSDIFFWAEGYKYDAIRDELINNESVVNYTFSGCAGAEGCNPVLDRDVALTGIITANNGISALESLNYIGQLKVADNGSSDGKLKYANTNTALDGNLLSNDIVWATKVAARSSGNPYGTNYYEKTGDNQDMLYQFMADLYAIGGNYNDTTKLIWYARENYVISNSGAVKTKNDFVGAGLNLFTLLKESAAQSIMYVKEFNSGAGLSWDTIYFNEAAGLSNVKDSIAASDKFVSAGYPTGTNIDLVIIPDLMVAGVQKVLPALDKLKN